MSQPWPPSAKRRKNRIEKKKRVRGVFSVQSSVFRLGGGVLFRLPILLITFAMVFLGQARGEWEVQVHQGRTYVTLEGLAEFYGFTEVKEVGKGFVLSRPGLEVRGRKNQKAITINGLKLYLSFPIVPYSKKTLVSVFDVTHTIDAVLRPPRPEAGRSLTTVVIDPAHGGDERGVRSKKFGDEKGHMLAIATALKAAAENNGLKVIMTREGDTEADLEARALVANALEDETVFISLHANAGKDPKTHGIETYTLAPAGTPATYDPPNTTPDRNYYLGNLNEGENAALAMALHGSLIVGTRANDLGIKRSRFGELRRVRWPAVMLRLGYLSNTREGGKLADPTYQKLIADSVASGLMRYARYLEGGGPARGRAELPPLEIGKILVKNTSKEARDVNVGLALAPAPDGMGPPPTIDPSKIDVEIYAFDKVGVDQLEPTDAMNPEIEWLSITPNWEQTREEVLSVHYKWPEGKEAPKRDDREFYGYVIRLLYDGKLAALRSVPYGLHRGLYQFYAAGEADD